MSRLNKSAHDRWYNGIPGKTSRPTAQRLTKAVLSTPKNGEHIRVWTKLAATRNGKRPKISQTSSRRASTRREATLSGSLQKRRKVLPTFKCHFVWHWQWQRKRTWSTENTPHGNGKRPQKSSGGQTKNGGRNSKITGPITTTSTKSKCGRKNSRARIS